MAGNSSTPKARALGTKLREAREHQGISQRKLAQLTGFDNTVLSRWESGQRAPKPADVAAILDALGVRASDRDEIMDLARGAEDPRWLAVSLPEQRQQLTALLEFERSATTITEVSPLLIPGLLQANGYVRSIMTGGGIPPGEVETRIAVRRGRQDVITSRKNPARFLALVGETALKQLVGNAEVMVEQLDHLLEMARRPNVDLRIVPFRSGWHPALEGPFFLIESEEHPPVVHLENRKSGLFLHEEEDLVTYRQAVDAVRRVALSPEQSTELITEEVDRWRAG